MIDIKDIKLKGQKKLQQQQLIKTTATAAATYS